VIDKALQLAGNPFEDRVGSLDHGLGDPQGPESRESMVDQVAGGMAHVLELAGSRWECRRKACRRTGPNCDQQAQGIGRAKHGLGDENCSGWTLQPGPGEMGNGGRQNSECSLLMFHGAASRCAIDAAITAVPVEVASSGQCMVSGPPADRAAGRAAPHTAAATLNRLGGGGGVRVEL